MDPATSYQHLLAAVELDEDGEAVARRALALAQAFGARLSLLHVLSYVPLDSGEAIAALPLNYMNDLEQNARARMEALCNRIGLAPSCAQLSTGVVIAELLSAAVKNQADLIVVGHHAHRGLMALFSHTDEDVVRRAPCDVLALKL